VAPLEICEAMMRLVWIIKEKILSILLKASEVPLIPVECRNYFHGSFHEICAMVISNP
jgi:hypothetical protein